MSRRRHWDLGDGVVGYGPRAPTDGDRAEAERFKRFLRGELSWREAREYAGLSIGQACKLLGVARGRLETIEAGAEPDELLQLRLQRVYGYVPSAEGKRHGR